MNPTVKRFSIGAAIILIGAYVGVVAYATAHKSKYYFSPTPEPSEPVATRAPGLASVVLRTPDKEHIRGWWIPPEPGKAVVLYLHGNSGNLNRREVRLADVANAGFGVLAIDYRGYGGSTGWPTEKGVYTDAATAWAYVQRNAPGAPVVIWGESLGSAVAVHLADKVGEAGVILDSPFSSMADMIRIRAPWYPAFLLMGDLNTKRDVARIGSPLLVAHCRTDGTTPFRQGEAVFAAARQPKQFVPLDGCAHIEIWREPARTAILNFLNARSAGPRS